MLCIRGASSTIAQAVVALAQYEHRTLDRNEALPLDCDRYLFCQGMLIGKRASDQSNFQIAKTFLVNAGTVIAECDDLIEKNDKARICVVGSESGFSWSYDGAYAAAKAALHRYVETKKLRTRDQQLVCVAPGVIRDAGMTQRRRDWHGLALRESQHPKKRFLLAYEVARLIHFLLYVDDGYISNTVVRMNGGEHLWR